MSDAVVGIDLGTSSVKVVALGLDGALLASAQVRYPVDRPRPGWAEQEPQRWWAATCEAIAAARSQSSFTPIALGLSGQMHGLVAVDGAGRPVRPAIIWSDTRSGAQVRDWTTRLSSPVVEETTGMPISTGMLAVSLSWVRDEEPELSDKIASVFSAKDYLRFRLTGEIATEPTDAAGGLLYDIHRGVPAMALGASVGLDAGLLAPVQPSLTAVGTVTADAARETGLPIGLPVAAGGGDQAMGALALGLSDPRRAAVAISSGGTVFKRTAEPLDAQLGLHVMPSAHPAQWMAMGVVLAAGLSIDWLASRLLGSEASPAFVTELMASAAAVGVGAGGLLASPHLGGTRTPVVDGTARAAFFGLGFEHDRAHMAKALVEGVCISLNDALVSMADAGQPPEELVVSGGGARFDAWRTTLADVTGLPVHVSSDLEHSALGAALAGAHAVGAEVGFEAERRVALTVEPDPHAHDAYQEIAERLRRVTAAANEELSR